MIRLPKELGDRLTKDAEANGVSVNQWIIYLLSKNIPPAPSGKDGAK
jgi:predicted HicB family RNase H-like nuclease